MPLNNTISDTLLRCSHVYFFCFCEISVDLNLTLPVCQLNTKMSNPLSPQRYYLSNAACPLDISGMNHNSVPIVVGQDLIQHLSLTVETCTLLPSESLSVTELINLCLPTFSGVMPSMDPHLCFSNHPPTESVAIYLSLSQICLDPPQCGRQKKSSTT
jgi:hypothetical protein